MAQFGRAFPVPSRRFFSIRLFPVSPPWLPAFAPLRNIIAMFRASYW